MIEVDRLRTWLQAQDSRLRPLLVLAATRLHLLASTAAGRLRPLWPLVAPRLRQLAAVLRRLLSAALAGLLPVLARAAGAIGHQLEAGRAARATPKALRDVRGRRLRSSAYLFGPEGPRDPRRRLRGSIPRMAGSILPAGLKVALVFLIAGTAFLGSSSAYINYAAELPDAHQITDQPLEENTQIFAADGTLIADIHDPNQPKRYWQSLDSMGRWLPLATVAIEDQNFWAQPGVDVFAMARAAWIDWHEKKPVQGASTITQQLVKLRLVGNAPTVERKIKEAVLAIQVERTYTKREILEQYLNTVEYGNNSKGSLAAARVYFHKDTKDLTLAEAAMLAGIPQSPRDNDPFTRWDKARKRQLNVLDQMVRNRMISQEQADEAYAQDLSPPEHMFKAGPQVFQAPAFVDWVVQALKNRYGEKAAYGGGLRVHTTVNLQLQQLAQQAVVASVNANRGRNLSQGSMVAIDPRTGAVLAMVGSADPNNRGGQYNMAVWPPRNPGSSFKIYTYTAGIESGKYTMATPIPDTPLTIRLPPGSIPPTFQPKNYDGKTHGICQFQACIGNSLNIPAVKVEITVGVDRVVEVARRMGAPPWQKKDKPDGSVFYTDNDPAQTFGYSLTLGGYGETPLQMATGASVLGAQGVYHEPFGIAAVRASDGTEVFKHDPNRSAKQVLDPRVAYIMEQIMSDDANRCMIFGCNSKLTLPGRRVGAKTGTTNDFADAWTVGYTPSLASAFWFGNPDYSKLTAGSDAIYVAAPAWNEFMKAALDVLKTPPDEWFAEPAGLGKASVGGRTIWLMPGTSANQPAPPLPSFASSPNPEQDKEPKPGQQ